MHNFFAACLIFLSITELTLLGEGFTVDVHASSYLKQNESAKHMDEPSKQENKQKKGSGNTVSSESELICPSCSQRILFPDTSPPSLCHHCGEYLSKSRRNLVFFLPGIGVIAAIVSALVAVFSIGMAGKEAKKAQEAAEIANDALEALMEPLISSLDIELKRFVEIYGYGGGYKQEQAQAAYEAKVEAQVIVIETLLDNIESMSSKTGRKSFLQFESINGDLMTRYFDTQAAVYAPTNNVRLDERVILLFERTSRLSE